MNAASNVALVCTTIASNEYKAKIKQALPANVNLDQFTRTTLTAIQQNPAICNADKNSLYNAVVRAAQDGLMPDGREGAIVAFGDKATWMPMVFGIIKKLGQAGIKMDAQVVHENDEFQYEFGDDAKIIHKPPKLGKPRGEMIGAYAIATGEGYVMREVMDADQIEAVRQQSRAKDSLMWTKFKSEAWRKTVVRRLAKRVPVQIEGIESVLRSDDETYTFDDIPQEAAPEPTPAEKKRPRALQAVVDAAPVTAPPATPPAAKPVQPALAPQGSDDDVF
jgi:recombination protein RecT